MCRGRGAVLGICALLQQCLDGTHSGIPLLPVSNHPPTSFLVAIFRTIFSDILCIWMLWDFSSLLPNDHELPDSSELPPLKKVPPNSPGQHASVSLLYLSHSRLLFPPWQTRWLQGVPSLRMCRSHPRMSDVDPEAMEATRVLEKTWSGAFWICDPHPPHPPTGLCWCRLSEFLESHFLNKEGKLIKKVANTRLTSGGCPPSSPPPPSPSWVWWVSLQKPHPQAHLGASRAQPHWHSPSVRASESLPTATK